MERNFSVLHVDFFVEALQTEWFTKVYDLDYSCKHYKIVLGREYWRAQDYTKYNRVLESAYKADPSFLQRYSKRTQEVCDVLSRKSNRLRTTDWSVLSGVDIARRWLGFVEPMLSVAAAINMRPVEFIEEKLEPILSQLSAGLKPETSQEELASIISNINKPIAFREEPLDLLRIGAEIQEQPETLRLFSSSSTPMQIVAILPDRLLEAIENHQRKYSWLNSPYTAVREPSRIEDYVERLQYLVRRSDCAEEVRRIERLRQIDATRFNTLLEAAASVETSAVIQAARDFAFLRTHLAEVFDYGIISARETILLELQSRLQLSEQEVVSMTIAEIWDSAAKGVSTIPPGELNARLQGYVYVLDGEKRLLLSGRNMSEYIEDDMEEKLSKSLFSVQGMIANRGFIVGPAKILRSPQDNWKVNAGDVIVATMTTPDYVPAMEKASAFVTDEGGITSHAAITSREFGVPCVVGTEYATKIFNDNDIIIVDAEKSGIVRRI